VATLLSKETAIAFEKISSTFLSEAFAFWYDIFYFSSFFFLHTPTHIPTHRPSIFKECSRKDVTTMQQWAIELVVPWCRQRNRRRVSLEATTEIRTPPPPVPPKTTKPKTNKITTRKSLLASLWNVSKNILDSHKSSIKLQDSILHVFAALCEASTASLSSEDVLRYLLNLAVSDSHAHTLFVRLCALRWVKCPKDLDVVLMTHLCPPSLSKKDKAQVAIDRLLFRGVERVVNDDDESSTNNIEKKTSTRTRRREWCRRRQHRRLASEALANALKQTLQTMPYEASRLPSLLPICFLELQDRRLLRSIINNIWSEMLAKGKIDEERKLMYVDLISLSPSFSVLYTRPLSHTYSNDTDTGTQHTP